MTILLLAKVLANLQANGLDDIPKSLKTLEQLPQKFQKTMVLKELQCMNEEDVTSFCELACSTYMYLLPSAKLPRALNKVLKLLPTTYLNEINTRIEHELFKLLTQDGHSKVKSVSALLEHNSFSKTCVKKYFPEVTLLMVNALRMLESVNGAKQTIADLEYSHYVFKLLIQVEQLFQAELKDLFHPCNDLIQGNSKSEGKQWELIVVSLLKLFLQITNRDVLLLIGTAIGMSFNLALTEKNFRSIYIDLISMLTKEKSCVTFKDVDINMDMGRTENADMSNQILAVIKGLLVCGDTKVLNDDGCSLMLHVYPHVLKLCLGPVQHHYLAFQILSLWYQKFLQFPQDKKVLYNFQILQGQSQHQIEKLKFLYDSDEHVSSESKQLDCDSQKVLFSVQCPVLRSTLSCVWLNWNSPVGGVTEYVIELFSVLLRLWNSTLRDCKDNEDLCHLLLEQLVNHETQLRTKYRALALLLPYVDGLKLVQQHAEIIDELTACMKTNHMAAVATDLYKAFIEQLQLVHGENCTALWKQIWINALISGLTSEDNLQRSKTCTYWLVPTLKIIPDSHIELLNSLEEQYHSEESNSLKHLFLFGWVNVHRFLRDFSQVAFPIDSLELLHQALSCPYDDIRSEAFLVICNTMKKAEPLSEAEVSLLTFFIPNNLKTDSAPFRHNLISGVRKLLVRIRDSCLTAVNKKRTNEEFLERSVHFVDWFYKIVMMSLAPGSAYQCRRTCVDILTAILEILIYDEQDTSRKGKAQESSNKLIHFVRSKDLWNFFSEENFVIVLACLEDGAQEIQTLCYNLLDKYFHWPTESCDIKSSILPMIQHAAALLPSPRAYEAHSGKLLMSLVLKKFVLDLGLTFSLSYDDIEMHYQAELVSGSTDVQPSLAFVDMLLVHMKGSLEVVTNDLATGFRSHPIHGWTKCVTQILTDVSKCWKTDFDSGAWSSRLQEVYSLNQTILNLMLDVMAGGTTLDNCPSFADMGTALMTLISSDEDSEEGLLSISPAFQLLLSWCWLNIKESSACLGELTHVVLQHSEKCLLSVDVLHNIGQIFVKVLTTCRHRGAIEGCRDGFFIFCCSLLSSSDPYLNNIPREILNQLLVNLSDNSLSSSVTRRSAGLPIVVQTILQAAHKSRNCDLLTYSVEQLYTVACKPLPHDPSQLQDLSQSHALNILKVIFCDAMLAPMLMPLLSKMTVLVIEGFDSPSWAVRNAATQLISTLISRLLGQKNQSNSNTTMAEFGALYPELLDYLVCKLQSSLTMTLSTSLYIVFNLISKLGSTHSHQQESDLCSRLQNSVSAFISNPVYSLRNLSAKAYVVLSMCDKSDDDLAKVLIQIKDRNIPKNALHGWLLCVQNFLVSEKVSQDMLVRVIDFLLTNDWLLSYTPCLMVTRSVMDIIQFCVIHGQLNLDLVTKLWSMLNNLLKAIDSPINQLQVDGAQCFTSCLQTLLEMYTKCLSTNEVYRLQLCNTLTRSLSSPLHDVRGAALDCLDICLAKGYFISEAQIQKELLAQMFRETTAKHFVKMVDIVINLKLNNLLLQDVLNLNISIETLKSQWRENKFVTDVLFSLEGLLFGLATNGYLSDRVRQLCLWAEQVVNYSQPYVNENLRLMAAQSLCVAGENIVKFCCTCTSPSSIAGVVTSLIRASILLLEDTESDVREAVARFVCHTENKTSLHYALCYPLLTSLIVRLPPSDTLLLVLLDTLFVQGQLSHSLNVTLNWRSQQLFEPELASAFSEPHRLQLWAFRTLMMITGKESLRRLLNEKLKLVLTELTKEKYSIQRHVKYNGLLNSSCNAKVMSAIFGIILLSQLYEHFLKTSTTFKSEEGDSVCEQVRWLQQNTSLHPFLHTSWSDFKQT
uniref:Uncharacterized protein n=1 Tax=Biomphalaria glabrata TaxID=6526 RepID=A0A2C9LB43_BIOGL